MGAELVTGIYTRKKLHQVYGVQHLMLAENKCVVLIVHVASIITLIEPKRGSLDVAQPVQAVEQAIVNDKKPCARLLRSLP